MSIVSFWDDGTYYLAQESIKESIAEGSDLVHINLSLSYLEDLTPRSLEALINNELLNDDLGGESIIKVATDKTRIICILNDINNAEFPLEIIKCVDILTKQYQNKIKFVYIVEDPTFLDSIIDSAEFTNSIFETVIFKRINEWEPGQLAKTLNSSLNVTVNDEDLNEIVKVTSGHFGLTKRLVLDKIFGTNSAEIYTNYLLKKIKSIGKKDGEMFPASIRNILPENLDESMLDTFGIKYIENFKNKSDSEKQASELQVDFDLLNPSERQLVKFFIRNFGTVCDKESTARIIWGDERIEKYSEWAIDQRINRLKHKLLQIKSNLDIQTVYGKGFKPVMIPAISLMKKAE